MIYLQEFAAIAGGGKEAYLESVRTRLAPHLERTRGMRIVWLGSTIGSSGAWPETIALWELRDWAHYAEVCARAYTESTADSGLRDWWQEATRLRLRSRSQTLVARRFSPSLDELVARKAIGKAFAFSSYRVRPGEASPLFDWLEREGSRPDATLLGAYEVAFANDRAYAIWIYSGLDEITAASRAAPPGAVEQVSEHWGYASSGTPLRPSDAGAKVW